MMKKYVFVILTAILAASCSSDRIATDRIEIATDTIADVRYERIQAIDTIYIELPQQSAERTIADSVSHLETDYAESLARINADGSLYHDLRTKAAPVQAFVPTTTERKDSIIYITNTKYVETPVCVEKELTWWEKFQIRGFGVLLMILLISLSLKYGRKITKCP